MQLHVLIQVVTAKNGKRQKKEYSSTKYIV